MVGLNFLGQLTLFVLTLILSNCKVQMFLQPNIQLHVCMLVHSDRGPRLETTSIFCPSHYSVHAMTYWHMQCNLIFLSNKS